MSKIIPNNLLLLNLRQYSYKSSIQLRGKPIALNIVDPWVPPSTRSISFQEEFKRIKQYAKKIFCYYKLIRSADGFKRTEFLKQVEELYVGMNESFANKDKNQLHKYVTDSMLAKMSPEMKPSNRLGKYVWKSYGLVKKPQIVSASIADVMVDRDLSEKVAQLTVRISSKQAMAIYKNDQLIAGSLSEPTVVDEFIVFEKWLTVDGSEWKIAGKIKKDNA